MEAARDELDLAPHVLVNRQRVREIARVQRGLRVLDRRQAELHRLRIDLHDLTELEAQLLRFLVFGAGHRNGALDLPLFAADAERRRELERLRQLILRKIRFADRLAARQIDENHMHHALYCKSKCPPLDRAEDRDHIGAAVADSDSVMMIFGFASGARASAARIAMGGASCTGARDEHAASRRSKRRIRSRP